MANETFLPLDSLQAMTYIIKVCKQNGIELNITKLQKLMFCCYGTVLAKYGDRLIDEYPAAWQYGPVFPEALRSVQFFKIEGFENMDAGEADQLPEGVKKLILETLTKFGCHTASQLSRWTHLPGSPWHNASSGGMDLYGRISDDEIREYFRQNVLA